MKRKKREAIFWELIDIRGKRECWPFKRCKGLSIYGYFWTGEKVEGAHRYSLELKLGRKLRKGECALHKCDNKACVNPAHLFVGTNLDNSRDMVNKGRKERGSDVYGAVLTEKQVRLIRTEFSKGQPLHKLAKQFHIGIDNLYHVVQGRTWRHVGGPIDTRTHRKAKKLTWEDAVTIRKLYKTGQWSMSVLGRKFNVCAAAIHGVVHMKSWKKKDDIC